MRLLFLTNFYLIHGSGGEEESCRQVVEGLRQRGHTTLVLTSMRGSKNNAVEVEGVNRSLYLEMDLAPWRHSIIFFTRRKAREKHNLKVFERVLEQFEPDIIFIWGMWNLPRSLPVLAEARFPDKVVYRFASYWPTLPSAHEFYWRAPGRKWYSRILKRVLSPIALAMLAKEPPPPPLAFTHAICVSAASRDHLVEAGIPVSHARIIYTGLDVTAYLKGEPHRRSRDDRSLNLLYAGRLTSDKGIETAIEAMKNLVLDQGQRQISLSLAGSGSREYEKYLQFLVDQAGLTNYVSFLGWMPPDKMPGLIRRFDVLLLPSIWPEPFARVLLEAMISGLVVVATPTGGTPEIVIDGENGLLFSPGNPTDLDQKIISLATDPKLRRRLALAGRGIVVKRFTKTKWMDEVERYLKEVVCSSAREKAGQFQSV